MVGAMRGDDLAGERFQARQLRLQIFMVLRDDMPGELRKRRFAPVGLLGAGLGGGHGQGGEDRVDFHVLLLAGNGERLAPSAAIVDSEALEDPDRSWLVQGDLADGFSDGWHNSISYVLKIGRSGVRRSDQSHFGENALE